MQQDERYHRAMDAALQLAAFVRERPDSPEHVIVSNFVFTILAAMAGERTSSADDRGGFEPSVN